MFFFIHSDSVRVVSDMRRAVVVAKDPEKFPDLFTRESGYLDIWWVVHDGGLMLLMMFLLKQHKVWKKCNLRLFTVARILLFFFSFSFMTLNSSPEALY